jgi:hypothetical protein
MRRLLMGWEPIGAVGIAGAANEYACMFRFPVRRCLQAILNEDWEHRLSAGWDLDALESRSS